MRAAAVLAVAPMPAVAGLPPLAKGELNPAVMEFGRRVMSFVTIRGDGDYPLTQAGWIFHKEDLSDLGEPYLSAVKAFRECRAVISRKMEDLASASPV